MMTDTQTQAQPKMTITTNPNDLEKQVGNSPIVKAFSPKNAESLASQDDERNKTQSLYPYGENFNKIEFKPLTAHSTQQQQEQLNNDAWYQFPFDKASDLITNNLHNLPHTYKGSDADFMKNSLSDIEYKGQNGQEALMHEYMRKFEEGRGIVNGIGGALSATSRAIAHPINAIKNFLPSLGYMLSSTGDTIAHPEQHKPSDTAEGIASVLTPTPLGKIAGLAGKGAGLGAKGLGRLAGKATGIGEKIKNAETLAKGTQSAEEINKQAENLNKMKEEHAKNQEDIMRNPQNATHFQDKDGRVFTKDDYEAKINDAIKNNGYKYGLDGKLHNIWYKGLLPFLKNKDELEYLNSIKPFADDSPIREAASKLKEAEGAHLGNPDFGKKFMLDDNGKIVPNPEATTKPSWVKSAFNAAMNSNPKTAALNTGIGMAGDILAKRAAEKIGQEVSAPNLVSKTMQGVGTASNIARKAAPILTIEGMQHAPQQPQSQQDVPMQAASPQTSITPQASQSPQQTQAPQPMKQVPADKGTFLSQLAHGFLNVLTNPELGEVFKGWASTEPGETWAEGAARGYDNQQHYHSRLALLQREGIDHKTAQQLALDPEMTKQRLEQVWKGRGDIQTSQERAGTGASPLFNQATESLAAIKERDKAISSIDKIKDIFKKEGKISLAGLYYDAVHGKLWGETPEAKERADHLSTVLQYLPQDTRERFLHAEQLNDVSEMSRILDDSENILRADRNKHAEIYKARKNAALPEIN